MKTTTTHDISKAVIKAEIEWNRTENLWSVTLTRLDGSRTSFNKRFMQDATYAIEQLMEEGDLWP